jgi:hypothetical protein
MLFLVEIEPTRVKFFIIPCKKCQFSIFSQSAKVSPKFNLNVDLKNLNAKLAGGERSIKS